MTYVLGIALAACIPALLTLSVLYARAVRSEASERVKRGQDPFLLAKAGLDLRASQEQRERLRLAVARYSREIQEIEEECVLVGDVDAVRRRLGNLLHSKDEGGEGPVPSATSGPVPDWVSAPDPGGTADDEGV